MFGKSKPQERSAEPNFFGWTQRNLDRLDAELRRDQPRFDFTMTGLRQGYGRRVNDPNNPQVDNELIGLCPYFGAPIEGSFGIAPIGTVGGLRFAGYDDNHNGTYRAGGLFYLEFLDQDQMFPMQRMLQTAFTAKLSARFTLTLQPVQDVEERISELREDGGFDALPLNSFHVIVESGTGKFAY